MYNLRQPTKPHIQEKKPSRAAKVLKAMALVLVILVGLSAIFVKLSGWKFFNVQTGSMVPALSVGALVVVKPVGMENIAKGDIVTFAGNVDGQTVTVTHRVTEADPDTGLITTKGDANDAADDPVHYSNVLGEVAFSVPLLGYILRLARHPLGLVALLYIPAIVVIVSEVKRLAEHYGQKAHRVYRLRR